MSLCNERHPDGLAVCDKTVPCSGYHADSAANVVWGYAPPPEPKPRQRRRTRGGVETAALAEIAQRAE